MPRSLIIALAAAAVVLAGCSADPTTDATPSATAAAVATQAAKTSAPPTARLADLPPAPPLETWVRKGNDFQMTLDLNVQTELIKLGVPVGDVDEDAARAYAYYACSTLRKNPTAKTDLLVTAVYPTADQPYETLPMLLAAKAYCLDTV